MECRPPAPEPHGDAAPERDYTGAVYGSLLAASVVVGASVGPFPRLQLVLLLLGTAVVFWATHVFAQLFGERIMYVPVNAQEIRRMCATEWPIVTAAVPPAVAVAVTPLLGIGPRGASWLALGVALAGHVGWSTVAAKHAGATGRTVVTVGAINLVLGLLIVVLKVTLTH
ncbi:hypothetical protein [Streptomyces colonosanans]|uniref:Integral membrane protein n=1 Tax=Streptomyces colonosanans TaxID=1428652 RepID=A0A1S2Q7A2_9ACTN|nr:hypothetical protein [Streptomyces colonosanans]OIK01633.1 hypothetical protein BIV24_00820 [Streptomyces colonosanans]